MGEYPALSDEDIAVINLQQKLILPSDFRRSEVVITSEHMGI